MLMLVHMLAALSGPIAPTAPSGPPARLNCTAAQIQSVVPADTKVVSAAMVNDPVPHCRVEGYVTTVDPGPNRDQFRIDLPTPANWNRRFYFRGVGGAAGSVPPGPSDILRAGYVVAVTDTGHQGHGLDWSFMNNRAQALDYLHRGGHVATVAAQQLTRAYYGVDKFFRYHVGCSNGGRMGLDAIGFHPGDYDGVLAGGAGGQWKNDYASGFLIKHAYASRILTREPGAWLPPAKLNLLEQRVTAACDATDGAVDLLVRDPRKCAFDVKQLLCKADDRPDCLTASQVKTVELLTSEPRAWDGEPFTAPVPLTNATVWRPFIGAAPPPWKLEATAENMETAAGFYVIVGTMARTMIRPDYDVLRDMDLSREAVEEWDAAFRRYNNFLPVRPDALVDYGHAGGKLIIWGGMSDPCCAVTEVEATHRKMVALENGDEARVRQYFALFEVPGIGHCGGGVGPQDTEKVLLETLVDWVEGGQTPASVVAHRSTSPPTPNEDLPPGALPSPAMPPRDYRLCAYPAVPVFRPPQCGRPDAVFDATNWACERPS